MEYGSIFGHGAYLGPDYTADYLHRAAQSVERPVRRRGLRPARREQTIADFQANRYDAATDTLTYTEPQAAAFDELERHYADFFAEPDDRVRACGPTRSTTPSRSTS